MTPEAMATLHARCFEDTPRPWTAAEFTTILRQPTSLLVGRHEGFALGRIAGPEVELLTLAVHPDARRRGIAATLVSAFEAAALARGAEESLLEVAVINLGARALYARLGYCQVGRRPAYYHRAGAPPVDALVLRKPLGPPKAH